MRVKALKALRDDTVFMTLVMAKTNRALTELISLDVDSTEEEAIAWVDDFDECLHLYEKALHKFNEDLFKVTEAFR